MNIDPISDDVSVYLCICASMNLYIYVSLYLYIYVSMFLCIYVAMYLWIYVSMYLCIYISMYLCTYVPMYLCIYVSMYLCICVAIHLDTVYLQWLQKVPDSKWKCAWECASSQLRYTLGGVIKRVCRCTWRPKSSEIRDLFRGSEQASLEMLLEGMMVWVKRWPAWRKWSNKFEDAHGAHDRVSLETCLLAIDLVVVDWNGGRVLRR
jgi:hypothetical protein